MNQPQPICCPFWHVWSDLWQGFLVCSGMMSASHVFSIPVLQLMAVAGAPVLLTPLHC